MSTETKAVNRMGRRILGDEEFARQQAEKKNVTGGGVNVMGRRIVGDPPAPAAAAAPPPPAPVKPQDLPNPFLLEDGSAVTLAVFDELLDADPDLFSLAMTAELREDGKFARVGAVKSLLRRERAAGNRPQILGILEAFEA